MRISRVFRKFVVVYLLLHVAAAILFLIFATTWISGEMKDQSFRRLEYIARLIRHQFQANQLSIDSPELTSQTLALSQELELRLTVMDANGRVMVDTEKIEEELENHSGREEIIGVNRDGTGTAYRRSSTTGERLFYLAVRYPESTSEPLQGFIRVAQSHGDFVTLQQGVLRYLWLSGLALAGISALVMWRFVQKEMEPLDSFSLAARRIALGQYESVPSSLNRNDEWRTLSDAFRHMHGELMLREAGLRDNSSRIEAVLTSMIEGVLAIDATGTVILANEAACEILSIDQSQLLGRKLLEVVRIPKLQRALEETQLRRLFTRVEFQTLTEPRKQIAARVSVMANEPQPGVAIVLHDETELRQLESVRRDFVANVSHELKTPLSAIKAYTETLQMGAINNEEKRDYFLSQIEIHAELLNQQIQDLLTLAKVESGHAAFNIQVVSVESVCNESLAGFRDIAATRAIKLQYNSRTPDLKVRADREELLVIINNLLSNAIRYSPSDATVTVSCYAESRSAVIEVTDKGIGIAPMHQARVFERFYRVDQARSRELGGTGLGLSIVKHLTQSMGGSVHLESAVGKGSTFRIKLPLGRTENLGE